MTITEGILLSFLFVAGSMIVSAECPIRQPNGRISKAGVFQQCWVGALLAGVPFGLGRLIVWLIGT